MFALNFMLVVLTSALVAAVCIFQTLGWRVKPQHGSQFGARMFHLKIAGLLSVSQIDCVNCCGCQERKI